MIEIEASILSADLMRLGEQAHEAETAGVDGIQIDIMDGRFVPNITFGSGIVRALRDEVKIKIDAHLMIVEPERYIKEFYEAGTDRLFVHQEACTSLNRVIETILELEMEAGVAINPDTSLDVLEGILDIVDIIQIMTVNPGFGGQEFLASQVDKIRQLRTTLNERGYNTAIAVDGGINTRTAPLVVSAGATVLVAGSSIYNKDASVAQNVKALRASIEKI